MNKIKVKREGREGVFLVTKENICSWLKYSKLPIIHCFINGGMMLGADWNKKSVIDECKQADRIAVLTGQAAAGNFGHCLAVIKKEEKLFLFQIGNITENDLEIEE